MGIRNPGAIFGAEDFVRTRPTAKCLRESGTETWTILFDGTIESITAYDYESGFMIVVNGSGRATVANLDHDLVLDRAVDHERFCRQLCVAYERLALNNGDREAHHRSGYGDSNEWGSDEEFFDPMERFPVFDNVDDIDFRLMYYPLFKHVFYEIGDVVTVKIFILHCFEDYTFRRLGEMFGMSHTAARIRFNKVCALMRLHYHDYC